MTKRKMKHVSQRNPADPHHAVGTVFRRGPAVAADGGERAVGAKTEETGGDTPVDEQKMKHVDQTPPDADSSANSVWERGGEPAVDDEASVGQDGSDE